MPEERRRLFGGKRYKYTIKSNCTYGGGVIIDDDGFVLADVDSSGTTIFYDGRQQIRLKVQGGLPDDTSTYLRTETSYDYEFGGISDCMSGSNLTFKLYYNFDIDLYVNSLSGINCQLHKYTYQDKIYSATRYSNRGYKEVTGGESASFNFNKKTSEEVGERTQTGSNNIFVDMANYNDPKYPSFYVDFKLYNQGSSGETYLRSFSVSSYNMKAGNTIEGVSYSNSSETDINGEDLRVKMVDWNENECGGITVVNCRYGC